MVLSCHGGCHSHVDFADLEAAGGNKLPYRAQLEGVSAGGPGRKAETGTKGRNVSYRGQKHVDKTISLVTTNR